MIPFFDLQQQYKGIGLELEMAALEVLRSGAYVQGRRVAAFEQNFAKFCGVDYAVALNSGTSALHLALLAVGVEPGDEVITVPATFVATIAAILYADAKPVLVDIDPETWTMDPALIERAITPRTKAVIPVHLHGRIGAMQAILTVARKHGIAVIEDAAQAHGAERDGQSAGSFGDIGCFSFYPGKNLGACGEGGAITTNRRDLAETVQLLRDWGQSQKYNHIRRGFNYRMEEMQGAILEIKLRHLSEWISRRRTIAAVYDEQLSGSSVGLPCKPKDLEHAYHVYAVRSASRTALQEALKVAGIATGIHYPIPVHLQPAYQLLGYHKGDFPVSEAFAAETLSLPIYPELPMHQICHVSDAIKEIAGRLGGRSGSAPERNYAKLPAEMGLA